MKVICDRGALLDAVNLVSGAVAARSPRLQLSCIKLVAVKGKDGARLIVSGTDAEISLRITCAQVDVQQPGEALIPAPELKMIVQAEDGDPTLTLETEGEQVNIRGRDAHFKVFGYPPSDFPPVPDFEDIVAGTGGAPKAKAVFTSQASQLSGIVARTVFATARENSRYAINGVLLKRDGKKIEMVATDGRRMALCRGTASGGDKEGKAISAIVPTKALHMLQRLVSDPEETIHIAITDSQIVFGFGSAESPDRALLSSNLVEGTFPPYEDVIPKDQDKKVTFDRDLLASGVRRAALLTNEESRGVRMKFNAAEKGLELTSRAAEKGEAKINVDLQAYEGEDVEIGFNPAFITDVLKVLNDPQVVLELKAPNKPGVMKSGNDFLYVVMPVNLT
jgi:DNA polymerase III subunit beta